MSDCAPWLRVSIDHGFGKVEAGFKLQMNFSMQPLRTVLFGPSGSGKSSLLRMIAGLLQPNAGTIELHGKILWQSGPEGAVHVPPEQRRVGLVMQSPAVFPHLRVAENVAFALRGMESFLRREKVAGLLHAAGAESLAARWPRELSGGQLQRVALARTLAAEPSVLLLDEPFAGLDAESRLELSKSVHRWARERNVPVLTVTHNLEEALTAGEDALIMQQGQVVAQGRPREVLATELARLQAALGGGL